MFVRLCWFASLFDYVSESSVTRFVIFAEYILTDNEQLTVFSGSGCIMRFLIANE